MGYNLTGMRADKHAGCRDGKHLACVVLQWQGSLPDVEVTNDSPSRLSPKTGGHSRYRDLRESSRQTHGTIARILVIDGESSTIDR